MIRICCFFLSTALACMLILSGCSTTNTSTQEEQAPTAKQGKVSLVIQDRGQVASSEGSYEQNRWTRWILQHGPVDVQFVPVLRSESKKILNVMFASGSAPDLINETNAAFRNYLYEQNQLQPFDELLDYMPHYKALLEQYPQLRKAGTKSDGKLYEIGRINEANPLHAMFIRQDWLDALGLEMPTTTEELLEVALAFAAQDPDQNGLDDTYGMNISYNSEGAINEMFGVQQNHSWGWQDGQIVRQWEKELHALEFKKRLYDLNIIDKEFMNDKDGSKAKQDFLNGKIGIYVNHSLNWVKFTINDLQKLKANDPHAVLQPLEYPLSPTGRYTGAIDNPVQMTTVLNASAADPVAAAKYIDFILEPSTTQMLLKGEEHEHWVQGEHGCPVYTDINKWQIEVGYASTGAYGLFLSKGTNPCNFVINQFNAEDPVQQEALQLYQKTRELYMDSSKQYPGITLGDYVPSLPAELDVLHTQLQTDIQHLYIKAIIGGEAYPAAQAIEDAKTLWSAKGGEQIVAYMNEWYESNKGTAFLAEDLWTIVDQQQQLLQSAMHVQPE